MSLLALLLLLATSSCEAFVAGIVPSRTPCQTCGVVDFSTRAPSFAMKEKKDVLELEGTVLESMPNANFRVQLDDTDQVRSDHLTSCAR